MRSLCVLMVLGVALAGCTQQPPPTTPVQPETVADVAVAQAFTGIDALVALVPVPGLDDVMLAVSQSGTVRVWEDGGTDGADGVRQSPFLEISDRVRNNGEQGLLGLALPPDFPETGAVYVHYSDAESRGDTRISLFQADPETLVADPGSEEVLLAVPQPYPNHNGGQMVFGPDGMLYIGLGDGGLAGDPDDNAQDTTTLLGAILRINPVRTGSGYSVPDGNPFRDGGGAPEVYVYGLRNPWRFSFDDDGGLWIGDVGQDKREEIDRLPAAAQAGANLGWPWFEGSLRFRSVGSPPETVAPVAEYARKAPDCAVVGGHVYSGDAVPALRGHYVFGDFCSGKIYTLEPDDHALSLLLDTELRISAFAVDSSGELLVLHHGGSAWRLTQA